MTSISESNMLRASHIIPWSHKIDSRLNPSNGLCLFVTYDHLFDQGYISFTNSLQVIITPEYKYFSLPLQDILILVQNTQAKYPIKYQIDCDYLDYHRKNILIKY
ncbi:HNH endonuclease [Geminocystis sp. NIES-3708]|uniref:HNH endonuclease n=1 Tax=Geminocystis sp. NIES-3708 TaxID=1615909 RepID=UPI0037BE4AE3